MKVNNNHPPYPLFCVFLNKWTHPIVTVNTCDCEVSVYKPFLPWQTTILSLELSQSSHDETSTHRNLLSGLTSGRWGRSVFGGGGEWGRWVFGVYEKFQYIKGVQKKCPRSKFENCLLTRSVCPRRLSFSQLNVLMSTPNCEKDSLLGQTVLVKRPFSNFDRGHFFWSPFIVIGTSTYMDVPITRDRP